MARLSLDKEGGAFFDLKISQRPEGFGAIAHLRVPKGVGRSSLVLHAEFPWDGNLSESLTFLHNDSVHFSFQRSSSGRVFFEARCFVGGGDIVYRAEVTSMEMRSFHDKLKLICEGILPTDD